MRPFFRSLLASVGLAAVLSQAGPARAVVVERIVAVVGDRPVLLSELRTRARPFLLQIQQRVPEGPQRAAAESQMFKELLERILDEELEKQAAERAQVTVTSEEVDAGFRNIAASQGLSVAQLFAEARKAGLGEQDYRDEIRRQLLEGKMLQLRVKGRVRVTEDDVKGIYERVLREERKLREYHPAWLVLRIYPGSSPAAVKQRRQLAADLVARARRGEDFCELVKRYSDDTATRDACGDLGIRAPIGSPAALTGRRETLAPSLQDALLEIEPNGYTGPIEAGDAIVVLKLQSRQPSRYTTFEAARPEMLQRVQADILEKAKRKWLEELKRRTHLEVRL